MLVDEADGDGTAGGAGEDAVLSAVSAPALVPRAKSSDRQT
jgi:hypothetical protein